ncbi:MAG TPA: lipopolysaccharide biosynthesis protein [Candidatus Dormibacteraeota bacterium]|nr:lipopolysaccharide biosynthesis protein [Candidatus Dormibacteraeota bacterium]
MKDLREKAVRGTLARVSAQFINLAVRVGSLAILARLLGPKDFGLVGMVAALTGVLSLFRDFGLSAASVQHGHVTEEQTSALFWINVFVGIALAGIGAACAPLVARLYHQPELYWVTIAMAATFLLNSVGIQHSALLQRELRFTAMSVIDTGSTVIGAAVGIGGAEAGWSYWALVAAALTTPFMATIGYWIATGWIPSLPKPGAGIGSMLRFGGTITANGIAVYLGSNFEKVLLGRYWGADAVGIYGRAYQLIRIPTDTLTGAVGEVAFSALSRLQNDAKRLRSYFLKGYSLVLALTLPATIACAVLAPDLIGFVLGPKWKEAAPIFRYLTPTILVFAIANPLSWMVSAIGWVSRGLKMSLVIAPLMIASYFAGLPYGPKGVAFAYSTIMVLWLVPVTLWSVHGTAVSFRDVVTTASRPLIASVVAGAAAFAVCTAYGRYDQHLARLLLGGLTLTATYLVTILYVLGQKSYYMDLLQKLTHRAPVEENALVSAQ